MNVIRNFNTKSLVIMVLCLVAFFVGNSMLPVDIMESRNIVTARNMVDDGNWMVPTMNGELRLEKPPLPTWVAAVIESVSPHNLGAQRAASGVMGCVWTMYVFLVARYISRRRDYAYIATLVFITCYNVVLMGRTASWDIYCHAFMMGAIYYLLRGFYDERYFEKTHTWRWFILAGIFMGLSYLSKGPVSFYALLLPFLIAVIACQRPNMRGKWLPLCVMIVVCLVISLWWYVCVYIFHPDAVAAVIKKESAAWVNHNVRPWWYYWRFFAETGVWALLTVAALAVPFWKKHVDERREYVMTVTWMLAALVLLSLMPEKKMRYLLPMMAPCSLSVAYLLLSYLGKEKIEGVRKWLLYVDGGIVAIITLALPILVHKMCLTKESLDMGTAIVVDIMFFGIGIYIAKSTVRLDVTGLIGGVAALFLVAECFMIAAVGRALGNPDRTSIKAVRDMPAVQSLPFYYSAAEPLRIELVYEARRNILPLNMKDEKAVMKAMPCVIVTRETADRELPKAVMMKTDTTFVGYYDDNRHPKTDRHYNDELLNHVTILKKK